MKVDDRPKNCPEGGGINRRSIREVSVTTELDARGRKQRLSHIGSAGQPDMPLLNPFGERHKCRFQVQFVFAEFENSETVLH